jgi:ureidoglycolate lyase
VSDLIVQPLTPEAYAPYGDVLMVAPRGEPGAPANQGTARRYDRLAAIENLRPATATLNVAAFRCAPRRAWPMDLELLEAHPASTQVFVPMRVARYLVVVARGGATAPDLGTLAAFVAHGAQGVSYRPGVWHHPMIALDDDADFLCLVHEDGSPGDCVVAALPERARPRLAAPR